MKKLIRIIVTFIALAILVSSCVTYDYCPAYNSSTRDTNMKYSMRYNNR